MSGRRRLGTNPRALGTNPRAWAMDHAWEPWEKAGIFDAANQRRTCTRCGQVQTRKAPPRL